MDNEKKVILIIDDEESMRDYMRAILEKKGYIVIEAENGVGALNSFATFEIDLIITDLVMPEKEGIEVIINMKKQKCNVKIIAISGAMNSEMYLAMAERLGASATLEKPFDRDTFLSTVERVLNSL